MNSEQRRVAQKTKVSHDRYRFIGGLARLSGWNRSKTTGDRTTRRKSDSHNPVSWNKTGNRTCFEKESFMNYVFLLAIGIGIVAGLRSLLAPAIITWAAHFGWLNLQNSTLAFVGSPIAVAIFSLFGIGELVADKLPKTPKRTAPVPLLARFLMGGLCGASLCAVAGKSLVVGALLGGISGVIGAFVGYEIRRRLVSSLHIKDFFVAVCEDLVAIGLAFFIVSR
jgi:uncharacterized membrane protein